MSRIETSPTITTPNAAAGIVKLYRAFREQAERLSDLSDLLAREGHETVASGAKLPMDEVREIFERRANHFDSIDRAAEAFHERLAGGDDLAGAIKGWMKREHGIVVRALPVHAMPNLRRRYDRHSMRLFLSERLSPFDQLREMALEACQLALSDAIAGELDQLGFSNAEARRIARFELARYAAHALMMPYGAFLAAAQRARYDVDVLRSRFQVSYEQVANRLSTLQRKGAEGVPFFLLEIDNAGHKFRRAGARGFPQARFGGDCPKLNIHAAFSQPGQILVDAVELTDGAEFLVVSRTLEGPQAAFNERVREELRRGASPQVAFPVNSTAAVTAATVPNTTVSGSTTPVCDCHSVIVCPNPLNARCTWLVTLPPMAALNVVANSVRPSVS